MHQNYRIVLAFFLTLSLTACTTGGNPPPLGRGYVAHHDQYKSAPGTDTREIGYEFNTETNNAVIEDMRYAAADLVSKLDKNLSFSANSIYLMRPESSAFYNSFDHLLRDQMVRNGYTMSPTRKDATPITFIAQETGDRSQNAYRKLYLALLVGNDRDNHTQQVGGIYEVPTYDFRPNGSPLLKHTETLNKKTYPASLQRMMPED